MAQLHQLLFGKSKKRMHVIMIGLPKFAQIDICSRNANENP